MDAGAFQHLRQNIEDIQKKLDKHEQTLFRIYNSEKGEAGQEEFVKYLTNSIYFYRARQSKLSNIADHALAQQVIDGYGADYTEPVGYADKVSEGCADSPEEDELFDEGKE